MGVWFGGWLRWVCFLCFVYFCFGYGCVFCGLKCVVGVDYSMLLLLGLFSVVVGLGLFVAWRLLFCVVWLML